MKWLKQQYIKPTYELTIFENEKWRTRKCGLEAKMLG